MGIYSPTYWANWIVPINATNLNKIESGINSLDEIINATAYSTSSTYAVGDYCFYSSKLYKCITAVTSTEAFDSNKWEETNILDELNNIRDEQAVEDITSSVTWNESVTTATYLKKRGNIVHVQLQGENKSRSHDQIMGTIASAYIPNEQVFAPAMLNVDTPCYIFISSSTGQIKIQMSGTVTGRVVANFSYEIEV